MPTHAEAIARGLAEAGVAYVWGFPGGETTAFMDACRRAGIRFLLTGNESSGALIAQTIGQLSGVPGVCVATLGPGATNLVTGVANAYLDRHPLIAVVAQIPQSLYDNVPHQRVDIETLFLPITKRATVVGAGDTAQLTRDCLGLASAPRPGPVLLVLPSDTANQVCVNSAAPGTLNAAGDKDGRTSLPGIRDRISAAQRPLIVVGLGAPTAAASVIRKFVDVLQAPFLVTPKVKGILPEDHPLFLGVATGVAIDKEIVETIHAADLLLCIGFDPVESTKPWFNERDVVAVDSASMAGGNYRPLEAIGDIASLVAELSALISEPKPWPEDLLHERRRILKRSPRSGVAGVSPLELIEGLRCAFPGNGIVTCDVGSHKMLMAQFWRSQEPGTFLLSNGLSGMGYGLPAAIAAQLVHPDRPVMAVVGDGGMVMMTHDLVLIRELSLPIVIVVFRDNSLSLIRVAQERRGYPAYGVDFAAPDFVALAGAFGMRAERATTVAGAQSAIARALSQRKPVVLEVPVDIREYYDLA